MTENNLWICLQQNQSTDILLPPWLICYYLWKNNTLWFWGESPGLMTSCCPLDTTKNVCCMLLIMSPTYCIYSFTNKLQHMLFFYIYFTVQQHLQYILFAHLGILGFCPKLYSAVSRRLILSPENESPWRTNSGSLRCSLQLEPSHSEASTSEGDVCSVLMHCCGVEPLLSLT